MSVASILAAHPVVLAPMEDVSDAGFRSLCRMLAREAGAGALLCVTEFIRAEQLLHDTRAARRKLTLAADDTPTAVQIYGADPQLLMEAAIIAAEARPAFLDINCGCWVPRIAGKGAGAGWLRNPAAMVEMAGRVVAAVDLPVTVKTRIGWGPESHMPIVDLARRLEDVGVAGLTIHCRTAQMGHKGAADWSWARRAREVVRIPVVVNGDVRTADDAARAIAETGCAAVMIGRAAITSPWAPAQALARLKGLPVREPSDGERLAAYRALALANVAARGVYHGLGVTRRHLAMLGPLEADLRRPLCLADTVEDMEAVIATAAAAQLPGIDARTQEPVELRADRPSTSPA